MLMLTLLLIASAGFSSAQKLHLKVTPVNVGLTNASLFDINDQGVMSGTYFDSTGASHGFVFDGKEATSFDDTNGTNTTGFGLNNKGSVVGWYTNSSGSYQGFLYQIKTKKFTDIGPAGSSKSQALYINDSGVITGGYALAGGFEQGFVYHPKSGKYTIVDVPNEAQSEARGIDSTGNHIVFVGYDASGNNYTSWLYCQGSGCKKKWSQIKVKGATGGAFAFGLDDALDITGLFVSSTEHSFLYHDANSKVYDFDPRGCLSSGTFGINNKQTIVGSDCKGLFQATYSFK
jgi:probable HAF family extracellular repeat protein